MAGLEAIAGFLAGLYYSISSISGVLAAVLIVGAAVLYGVGALISDPRMKAQYQSWAIQMVMGAIGMLLIFNVGTWVLKSLGVSPPASPTDRCIQDCCAQYHSQWCDNHCGAGTSDPTCDMLEEGFDECVDKCGSSGTVTGLCGSCS